MRADRHSYRRGQLSSAVVLQPSAHVSSLSCPMGGGGCAEQVAALCACWVMVWGFSVHFVPRLHLLASFSKIAHCTHWHPSRDLIVDTPRTTYMQEDVSTCGYSNMDVNVNTCQIIISS